MAASDELCALAAALGDFFISRSAAGLVLLDVDRGNGFHVFSFLYRLGLVAPQYDAFQPISLFEVGSGSKLLKIDETELANGL